MSILPDVPGTEDGRGKGERRKADSAGKMSWVQFEQDCDCHSACVPGGWGATTGIFSVSLLACRHPMAGFPYIVSRAVP